MGTKTKILLLTPIVAAALVALFLSTGGWVPIYEGWTGKEVSKNYRSRGDCRVDNTGCAADKNAMLVYLRKKDEWHVISVKDGHYCDHSNGQTVENMPYDGSPINGFTPVCEIRIRDYGIDGSRMLLDDTDALLKCFSYKIYTYLYLFSYRLKKSVSR